MALTSRNLESIEAKWTKRLTSMNRSGARSSSLFNIKRPKKYQCLTLFASSKKRYRRCVPGSLHNSKIGNSNGYYYSIRKVDKYKLKTVTSRCRPHNTLHIFTLRVTTTFDILPLVTLCRIPNPSSERVLIYARPLNSKCNNFLVFYFIHDPPVQNAIISSTQTRN